MSALLAILGPTASGKTSIAIDLARRIDAEIVSVDSMQVYRELDIGTAKPTLQERKGVPHHMIDVVEPEEEFTVVEFRDMARRVVEERSGNIVVTGGSGLHFRALVDPFTFAPTDVSLRDELEATDLSELVDELTDVDPTASHHVDLANQRRVVRAVEILRLSGATPSMRARSREAEELRRFEPELDFKAVGIDPGDVIESRIDKRVDEMRSLGLLDEVRGLQGRLGRTAASAVGYRELVDHLDGRCSEEEAFDAIRSNTRRLARKQRSWFRRDPRIRWVPWHEDPAERLERISEALL